MQNCLSNLWVVGRTLIRCEKVHACYLHRRETEMLGKFWWNEDGSLSDLFSLEITAHPLGVLFTMQCMDHCANRQEQETEAVMKRNYTWHVNLLTRQISVYLQWKSSLNTPAWWIGLERLCGTAQKEVFFCHCWLCMSRNTVQCCRQNAK